ncbi:MAG TPA: SPASM domain-containing protein, partial [Candidatus Deferrimicrobiaceae bacterium]
GPGALPSLPAIIGSLSGGFTRISLTLDLFPGAAEAAAALPGVETAWRLASGDDFGRLPEGAAAVSFVPDGDSIGRLPALLEAFSRSGARTLHLPNVNAVRALAETGRVPVPSPAQYAAFADSPVLADIGLGNRSLVVHDYFLWRLLAGRFPGAVGERLEFGGCQAGGALAYVDPTGELYPCDALPVRLGSLAGDASFQELWDSPARPALVGAIRATPAGCEGCEALPACRAGCRGMAQATAGTLDAPDPACPGPVPRR